MTLKSKIRTIRKKVQAIGKPRRVVYTCLFGYSERFLDQHFLYDGLTDYVCFTDDSELKSDFWEIVVAPKSLLDPHRRSKGFKHRPHLFFPNHEFSLYIDNTVQLTAHPSALFKQAKARNSSFMMFEHPERNCVFDEAEVAKSLNLDDPELIDKQMEFYARLNFQRHTGLHATTVMLRKHNDPKIKIAMNEWHDQVLRYSKRDQLSFDVIRHFFDLDVHPLPGSLVQNSFFKWPVVLGHARLPRDFDEHEYLSLNPDVRDLNIPAGRHYLETGIAEGRQYRGAPKTPSSQAKTFRVDPRDKRGRELQLSKSGQLNEPTYAIWEALLGQTEWTDIVDVGANYGEMLVRAKFPKSAKVLAIEPSPIIFPLLRDNIKNAGVNCDCLPIAVSSQVGVATLCLDLHWSGLSSLEAAKTGQSPDTENTLVPTMPLDAVIGVDGDLRSKKILLKIDVEGHELSVLEGMKRITFESDTLAVLVEVLHLDREACSKILEDFDVEIFNLETRSLEKIEPASLEQMEHRMQSDQAYKNDVVLRPRRGGGA